MDLDKREPPGAGGGWKQLPGGARLVEHKEARGALVWQSFALIASQSCTGQVEGMPWVYSSPNAATQFGARFSRARAHFKWGQWPWPALLIQHNDTGVAVITVSWTEICLCDPSIPEWVTFLEHQLCFLPVIMAETITCLDHCCSSLAESSSRPSSPACYAQTLAVSLAQRLQS